MAKFITAGRMKLSVIIVNYNVRYFLEQCLHSVRRAKKGIEMEVFVVDNNSVDNSVAMMREKFPEVKIIENHKNLGFSRANNQAIERSKGEYVLLLNPDTVIEDDTLVRIVDFMDRTPDAGGLGVKMIDGKGHYLPESKRGLPTPDVAFYKIFGLSKLFPRSRTFGKYHLGYLDKDKIHVVDILSGAFMLLRRSVLDKTGLLDENFFMYGEDIDLSYRINKAGYKNYYYPDTRIIHYKGESTKKGSINYVFVFYHAMVIFARKHFSHKNARLFSLLINMAIYFRATLALVNRFFMNAFLPLIDIIILYGGLFFITRWWEQASVYREGGSFPVAFYTVGLGIYITVWLISTYLSGGYDRPIRLIKVFQGVTLGTVFILVVYALLPENLRFSRAILLMGTAWGMISLPGIRILLHLLKFKPSQLESGKNRRFVIVGDREEAVRVSELLEKSYDKTGFIGLVNLVEDDSDRDIFIGNTGQLKDIIQVYHIDEVIFCSKSMPSQQIINMMSDLQDTRVDYKIAPEDSLSIIGSNSINTAGDFYTVNISSISKMSNRRNKRFLDVVTSIVLLLMWPLMIIFIRKPIGLLRNIIGVLFGRWTWVGYFHENEQRLPRLRNGILHPLDAFRNLQFGDDTATRLDLLYARDYHISNDLNIIIKGFRELGRHA